MADYLRKSRATLREYSATFQIQLRRESNSGSVDKRDLFAPVYPDNEFVII
jgi:hypothetical protein